MATGKRYRHCVRDREVLPGLPQYGPRAEWWRCLFSDATDRRVACEGNLHRPQGGCTRGLVTRLVDDSDLESETTRLAQELAEGPSLAFASAKKMFKIMNTPRMETFLDSETWARGVTSSVKIPAKASRHSRKSAEPCSRSLNSHRAPPISPSGFGTGLGSAAFAVMQPRHRRRRYGIRPGSSTHRTTGGGLHSSIEPRRGLGLAALWVPSKRWNDKWARLRS